MRINQHLCYNWLLYHLPLSNSSLRSEMTPETAHLGGAPWQFASRSFPGGQSPHMPPVLQTAGLAPLWCPLNSWGRIA